MRHLTRFLVLFPIAALLALTSRAELAAPNPAEIQPVGAPLVGLDDVRAGQRGTVWTVFQGTKVEPFDVEVTGVIRNALGPGKSLILCELTDPRVQKMGAVAGMSGSPLYIEGKLAGALSYQIQKFETVRYAGFTPISDLMEVSQLGTGTSAGGAHGAAEFIPLDQTAGTLNTKSVQASPTPRSSNSDGFSPLTPMFALGGVSPAVSAAFADRLQALGLNVSAIGGSTTSEATEPALSSTTPLSPGGAVAVALATGDITLAGTGTVSHVDGNRILAFGHPMMSLGDVELPMAQAEIVAILPSALNSFKVANTGAIIGTVRQDRLSAIYGEVGRAPSMLPVEVKTPARTLRFNTVRHPRITPSIAAMGLTQAVLGSNESGLAEGFRVSTTITYEDGQQLTTDTVYPGPQGFTAGLEQFVRRLTVALQNPIASVFPRALSFAVEPLSHSPLANLDQVQLSRTRVPAGEVVTVTLFARDFQGEVLRHPVSVSIPAGWLGRDLEVLVATGPDLDRLAGRPTNVPISQIRSFDAYLELLRSERRTDGIYVAVVERASAFREQMDSTLDYPGSLERIARSADDERFRKRDVVVPLWETHLLAGRLFDGLARRPLQVIE